MAAPTRRRFLALVAGVGVAAGAGSRVQAAGGAWPQFGATAQNESSSDVEGPRRGFEVDWRASVGGQVQQSPVTDGSQVYVNPGGDPNVYALSADTGEQLWTFEVGTDGPAPAVADSGKVLVGGSDGLYLLSDSGDQVQFFGTDRAVSSPITTAGGTDRVAFATSGDRVYHLEVPSLAEIWSFDTGGIVSGAPAWTTNGVVVTTSEGTVYCLARDSGDERWRVDAGSPLMSTAMVNGDTTYVATANGTLFAYAMSDGSEQWNTELPGTVTSAPSGGSNVTVASRSDVIKFAGLDGAYEAGTTVEGIVTTPVARANDAVYLCTKDGTVYGLPFGLSGDPWTFETGATTYAAPAVAGGRVFVGNYDGDVYALGEPAAGGTTGTGVTTTGTGDSTGTSRRTTEPDPTRSRPTTARTPTETRPPRTPTTGVGEDRSGGLPLLPLAGGGAVGVGGLFALYRRYGGGSAADDGSGDTAATTATGGGSASSTASTPTRSSSTGSSSESSGPSGAETSGGSATSSGSTSRSGSPAPSGSGSSGTADSAPTSRPEVGSGRPEKPPDSMPTAPVVSLSYDDIQRGERIGAGGNADVYRATASVRGTEIDLAVKEPRFQGTLHTEAVDRIMDEAEVWNGLDDHDHIVGVVDWGSDPLPWIAMEYMDAGHLGERIDGPSYEERLWYAYAVVDAMHHAHRKGVAHLDIKPANVLFRATGEDVWDVPKVADWGLSKQLLEHSTSMEGLSPTYAAPEQFDDDYGSTDDQTDVYQIGAVLYELFTGRPPFEGDATKVMRAVLEESPAKPSRLNDHLPQAVDELILKALAKNKADRYDSVVYMRDRIVKILERRYD